MSITFILLCVLFLVRFVLSCDWRYDWFNKRRHIRSSPRRALQLVVDWCDWLLCVSGTCQDVRWKAKKRYDAG